MRHDAYALRKLAWLGSRYGPAPLLRYGPKLIGAVAAMTLPAARRAIWRNLDELETAARAAGGDGGVIGVRRTSKKGFELVRGVRRTGLLLATFTNFASCLAESLASGRREEAMTRYDAVHREVLGAIKEGEGVVVLTAHIGSWDAASRYLGRRLDREVTLIMDRERDAEVARWYDQLRERHRVSVFHPTGEKTRSLALLRHLERGGVVAAQLDRVGPGQRALEVPFGPVRLSVPEGVFRLAALAGAPVITTFCRRVGFFHYEVELGGPVRLPHPLRRPDLLAAASSCAAHLADYARRYPTQWFRFDR